MKRLITGTIILLFLLGLGGWSLWKTTSSCKQLSETAYQALEYLHQSQNESAYEAIQQLISDWDEQEPILELLTRHTALDEIEVQINFLKEWIQIGQTEEAAASLSAIIGICDHIRESEPPVIHNIF